MDEALAEKGFLCTRSSEYKIAVKTIAPNGKSKKINLCKKRVFTCKEYNAVEWKTEIHDQCSKCLKYESVDYFQNDHLPTRHEVLQYLLCVKSSNCGQKVNNEMIVAEELVLYWMYCNVYPKHSWQVTKDIVQIFMSYDSLKKKCNFNKTEAYWNKYEEFVRSQRQLFDIIGKKLSQNFNYYIKKQI